LCHGTRQKELLSSDFSGDVVKRVGGKFVPYSFEEIRFGISFKKLHSLESCTTISIQQIDCKLNNKAKYRRIHIERYGQILSS
jgi:hypothetical protein